MLDNARIQAVPNAMPFFFRNIMLPLSGTTFYNLYYIVLNTGIK
jgi:hypothetical protein